MKKRKLVTSSGIECLTVKEAIIRELLENPNTPYKKIAEMFGTTVGTVKTVVREAKKYGILDPKKLYGSFYARTRQGTLQKLKEEISKCRKKKN